eukprot:12048235-Karenia_brevis.AAC.1
MEAQNATGVTQISPGRPGWWHGVTLAFFQFSCRSLWRLKVRQGSRKSALGGRGGGTALAFFQLDYNS